MTDSQFSPLGIENSHNLSAMKFIKNSLRNRMSDELMNNCLVTYIEKNIFDKIDNESIIQRFQNVAPRRKAL